MEQVRKKTAEERIKEAFFVQLRGGENIRMGLLLPRIGKVLDAHFSRYCSFYGGEKQALIKNGIPMLKYILPKELDKISVSALTREAGVNRATFYKFYPNVEALYEACCEDLTQRFLAVPVPKEKTPDLMFEYARSLWNVMREREDALLLLSQRVNRRELLYRIGFRLKTRLSETLSSVERSEFDVVKNLDVFPDMFAVWVGNLTLNQILPRLYPDRNLPVCRFDRSLIENMADHYAARYGGESEVYYNFGITAFKLLAQKDFHEITVSEFCREAGYPRSTFYAHFTDMTDYVLKVVENGVLVCVSSFLSFLADRDALNGDNLEIFRGETIPYHQDGIREIFRNGSIVYLFPMMFTYMVNGLRAWLVRKNGAEPETRTVALLGYYVSYAMRLFSMYYLGDMSATELSVRKKELDRLRDRLGLAEFQINEK